MVLSPSASLAKQPNRIAWIDYAKGLGIFLVVLGHTLRDLANDFNFASAPLYQTVDRWIYAFHIPLFFFIAGLFIERSVAKPLSQFLAAKLHSTVYPYFLWSSLHETLSGLAGRGDSIENIWRIIYEPVRHFGFLYVLFLVSLIYATIRKWNISNNLFILGCIALYTAHIAELSFGSWSIVHLIRVNAIYFAIGIFARDKHLLSRMESLSLKALIATAIAGFALVALAVQFNLLQFKPMVLAIALVGISAAISLAKVLETLNLAKFLANWGLLSTQIYVAHTLFSGGVQAILQKVFQFSHPGIPIIVGTIAGIYGPMSLPHLSQGLKLPYLSNRS